MKRWDLSLHLNVSRVLACLNVSRVLARLMSEGREVQDSVAKQENERSPSFAAEFWDSRYEGIFRRWVRSGRAM